jgi:hypothetical protein
LNGARLQKLTKEEVSAAGKRSSLLHLIPKLKFRHKNIYNITSKGQNLSLFAKNFFTVG